MHGPIHRNSISQPGSINSERKFGRAESLDLSKGEAARSTAEVVRMKYLQAGLALVLGIGVGVAIGYNLGYDHSEPAHDSAGINAAEATVAVPNVQDGTRLPEVNREWYSSFQAELKRAVPGQPTPRIVETIGEALQADPPLDTARLLMLIQMMRKEDFPVALRLFKTTKSNVNTAFVNANGPLAWTAFWQQFGAMDPDAAFASARECGDLVFQARETLEKHLFTGMARHNAEEAARRLLATPDLANRPFAAEGLVFEWAKTNPAAAVAWVQQNLTDEELKKASYASVWGASTFRDITGGNALLKTIPAGEMRSSAVRSLKSQILNKPHLPTAQIIDFMGITRSLGERDPGFEKQVVNRCANADPVAAANFYAKSLDDGTPNDYQNLRAVLKQWALKDRQGAETWVKGQERTDYYGIAMEELNGAPK